MQCCQVESSNKERNVPRNEIKGKKHNRQYFGIASTRTNTLWSIVVANFCFQAAGQLVIVLLANKHTNIKNAAVNIKPFVIIRYILSQTTFLLGMDDEKERTVKIAGSGNNYDDNSARL